VTGLTAVDPDGGGAVDGEAEVVGCGARSNGKVEARVKATNCFNARLLERRLSDSVVLRVEDEGHGVADGGRDVARAVRKLAASANLDDMVLRVRGGGRGGGAGPRAVCREVGRGRDRDSRGDGDD